MILEAHNLTIGYRKRRHKTIIAEHLDLTLRAGELVCLLGPNGAGKSTLMRTLAGMQSPLVGNVWLDGEEIGTLHPQVMAKKLSVVLTERVNAGLLSAYALVALGRYPHTDWWGTLSAEDKTIIQNAIDAVGIQPLASRPVSQLSDGERQKVMIARALAQQPKLMLLDEPTAFLDLPRRVEIMQILRRLAYNSQRAILLSTHDLDLALRSADTLWLMSEGKLHVGAPEDLVLSGAFAEAFASEGVTFDIHSGAFEVQEVKCGRINLVGEGVRAQWTARALQRIGYEVH
ncbi:MAG: ABC transporter ATP-binding protein, partial [Candidatus Promineifilaceae bacterium]